LLAQPMARDELAAVLSAAALDPATPSAALDSATPSAMLDGCAAPLPSGSQY
jgi:hypothetical protein